MAKIKPVTARAAQADAREASIAEAVVLQFDKDVQIENPDQEEGGKITVRNTFTVYRDGDWFKEIETGTDGFTRTRSVDRVNPKVCATQNLYISATPTTPRTRNSYSYGDRVGYKFNFEVTSTLSGKPVSLEMLDFIRLAKFADAIAPQDRYDVSVDAY